MKYNIEIIFLYAMFISCFVYFGFRIGWDFAFAILVFTRVNILILKIFDKKKKRKGK